MKKIFITILLVVLMAFFAQAFLDYTSAGKKIKALHLPVKHASAPAGNKPSAKFLLKAGEAKSFIQKNNYRDDYFFLLDLDIPSNKNRFFIFDLKKDSIVKSGLVTHGNCNQYWLDKVRYDNTVGCGCSSLGKYKIGYSYFGRFGLAFKLHGLDSSNSNAYKRYVVLHSHECVPGYEVEDEICQSNGCPTVSPDFLKELEVLIKSSKKPTLLWIIE